ncbi:MAG TPA: ATP-binding cassette domain-containing protein [Cyclobacteriaceae bacterium]|nr:ATP-binding cassette domain-containing protein [Cyclobacteriaceae bacterium]
MIRLAVQKLLNSPEGGMMLDAKIETDQGKFITLYGESGAGKTSLLRILAGLLKPENGSITVNGVNWLDTSRKINLRPQRRSTGFVFQDYALFPNMTVGENIEYALENKSENGRVKDLIDLFELGDLRDQKTGMLSGGQKQRVALARTLVRKPDLLLLDEPLSALDHSMRTRLQDYILRVHREFKLTTILVSHDVGEIFRLSDQVLVMEKGKITGEGTPLEIFSDRHISGKFQFTGEVTQIEKEDVIYIISVLIGNRLVKVVADETEIKGISPGSRVLVASKAFNPMIKKIIG